MLPSLCRWYRALALNIRNLETERLVRELARKRGLSLTEAVHEAVDTALKIDASTDDVDPGKTLLARLQPLFDRLDRMARSDQKADKAFFDDMWGESDI